MNTVTIELPADAKLLQDKKAWGKYRRELNNDNRPAYSEPAKYPCYVRLVYVEQGEIQDKSILSFIYPVE